MKLPKLYRVVYLIIEWVKDECVNGEHYQTGGTEYIQARVVILNGVRVWQILGHVEGLIYEDELFINVDEISYLWTSCDLSLKRFEDKKRHNPEYHSRKPKTIKQKNDEAVFVDFADWPF